MQSTTQPISRRALEEDEIRLLIYDEKQSQRSSCLACQTKILKLSHVNNGASLPYAALSYVWGDAKITQPLICDGVEKQVTLSLYQALSLVWRAYPATQLWADALSITQDNLNERNHQVSLMGDIFRSAERVFVSLGPALEGDNHFWSLLQSFATTRSFESEEFEEQLDEFIWGQSNKLSLGLNDLIQRPWFRRAWAPKAADFQYFLGITNFWLNHQTYQEIHLATAADVFCGFSFMPWNNFIESLDAFSKLGTFLGIFASIRTFIKEQAFMLKEPPTTLAVEAKLASRVVRQPVLGREKLLDLLVDGWPRDASDARDKIYAFTSSHLALASYAELRPDYTLDMRSTFIRLIRAHINNENDLNFLRFARGIDEPIDFPDTGLRDRVRWITLPNLLRIPPSEHDELKHEPTRTSIDQNNTEEFLQDDDLPSWVCDWRRQGLRAKVDVPPFLKNENYFDVRQNVLPKRQSVHDFNKRLVLKGIALARAGYLQPETTTGPSKLLGTFSRLPTCALEKACNKLSTPSQQSELFDGGAQDKGKNLPGSNMNLLLLQTLLHDRIDCGCIGPPDLDLLMAHCPYEKYPRSSICNLDWLFLFDGLADPVVLRPHIILGDEESSRAEIGFDFVSVCPLVIGDARQKWNDAPYSYSEIVLY